jgi:arylsulfatase A-like enzyme
MEVFAAYTEATGTRHIQYFEMLGNRALYKEGWIAPARHGRLPWETLGASTGAFDQDKWELYNLADDFSEANDVAAKYPQKLRELQNDFWVVLKGSGDAFTPRRTAAFVHEM